MQVKEMDINNGQIKGYGIHKKSTKSHFLVVLPLRLTLSVYLQKYYLLAKVEQACWKGCAQTLPNGTPQIRNIKPFTKISVTSDGAIMMSFRI